MIKTAAILSVIGLFAASAVGIRVCLAENKHACTIGGACCSTATSTADNASEPIACSLNSRELVQRREEIRGLLTKSARDIAQEGTRLRVTFPANQIDPVIEFIKLESDCCRFLTFTVTVPPSNGDLTLTINGPKGSEMFLQAIADAMRNPEAD